MAINGNVVAEMATIIAASSIYKIMKLFFIYLQCMWYACGNIIVIVLARYKVYAVWHIYNI